MKIFEQNSTISHYRIVAKIGAGGMGEVYLAEDTRLDRKVALKILPPEFAEDKDRMSRFVREAKSASALNHPNIITIHEIGESEGTHFIATEFIDGETLNAYAKANPLDYKSALEIAIQIASALDEAHVAGIVHRDIKPDNVMIRANGLVKILDFGIAKLSAPTESNKEAATAIQAQTQAGMIIGTPNYMSPEQARGLGVDHQTDIFSFGVVFYEMLSGASPFKGETVSDVIAAVLTKEAKPLANIPPELAAIVQKSLQKDKPKRYQTAKDLLDDLKEVKQELEIQDRLGRNSAPDLAEPKTQILKAQTTNESENKNSIAVLPFTNMSADEDNEYFCDGLAEELLNALSKIEDLKVAACTSAFSFKGRNANVSEIGEKLSVKNVLEGSVRRSGNRLRISVQLINAADGYQLWSERYDREMADIFDIQDEITLAVVDALKLKLLGNAKAEIFERKPNSAEALDLYLKGRFHFQQHTPAGFHKAIEYFQQATEQEPDYALAFAGLSSVLIFQWFFGFVSADEAIPKAKNVALRALELNSNLDEAHIALAHIRMFYERDLKSAEQEYGEAIRLNPNNAYARYQYGLCLAVLGKREQAIVEAEKAIELEPLSVLANFQVAAIYYQLGLFEESSRYSQRLLEMASGFYGGYLLKGAVLSAQGEFVEAIRLLEKALMLDKSQDFTKSLLGQAYGLAGNNTKASELIEELQNEREKRYVNAFDIARIYSSLRDVEKTVEWLGKAVEEQNGELVYLKLYANQSSGDIWGEALRSDKRFQDLLRRIYSSTDEPNQTDKSLEAKTVMLASEPPAVAGGLTRSSQEFEKNSNNSNADVQPSATAEVADLSAKPKSKWWLFGLLCLVLIVGGIFGYKYLSPTNKQINSIAVLPFENKSSDADTDYLSDGLAESLIYRLSQLPDLKVSPTSSVFRYKGKATDPQVIAKELGVDSVMTGRITQRGDSLTISVNLVDTRNGKSLWGEQYERKMSELLATQREIAAEITNNLKLKLSGESEQKLAKKYTDNNEAYQLYLKGRFYWNKRDEKNFNKAIEQFKAAADKDPNFALAFVGLADCYALLPEYGSTPSSEALPQAKAYATRALEIDDSLGEAHISLANVNSLSWNWEEANNGFRRGIELNPSYATGYKWYGLQLATLSRFDEALAKLKRAQELEPLSISINLNVADIYFAKGDYNAAVEQCQRTIDLDPNWYYARQYLGLGYLKQGRNAEALAEAEKSVELSKRHSIPLGVLGYIYAQTGKRKEAAAIAEELKEKYAGRHVNGYSIANVYVGLGDKEQAFAWLEKDFQSRSSLLPYWLNLPPLNSLRDDPRYKDLLKRMNLPE